MHNTRTSQHSAWVPDQRVQSHAEITGSQVTLFDVRNATYRTPTDFDLSFIEKTVDVETISGIDYVITPFHWWRAIAHTIVTFEFTKSNGIKDYIAFSIEIRRKIGQEYSPIKGIFGAYDIMYVVSTEEDVIKLRTNYRNNKEVIMLPIRADKEQMKQFFLSMVRRTNALYEHPETYHTLTNSCSTNLADHLNEFRDTPLKRSFRVLMPGYSDKLVYQLGLLDSHVPWKNVRKCHNIAPFARTLNDNDNFSIKIRDHLEQTTKK